MASILNQIGYFQFSNLVQNRIPFTLLSVDFDLPPFFGDFHDRHLSQQNVRTTLSTFIEDVKNLHLPEDRGIIVLSQNGKVEPDLVDQLEALGFKNVYFAPGGFEALLLEKKEN